MNLKGLGKREREQNEEKKTCQYTNIMCELLLKGYDGTVLYN